MIRWLRSLFRPRSDYRAYVEANADAVRAALRRALDAQPDPLRYRKRKEIP